MRGAACLPDNRLHSSNQDLGTRKNMRKGFRKLIRRDRSPDGASPVSVASLDRQQDSGDGPEAQAVEVARSPTPTTTTPALTPDNETVSENLWHRAYKELLKREPELIADYEQHIGDRQKRRR